MKDKKNQLSIVAFILAAVLLFLASPLRAQVTIGIKKEPDINALLDLKNVSDNSSTKGFLPPRVKLTSTASALPLIAPVSNGMTVYNTETTGDVTPGYYYWDSSIPKWVRVGNGGTAAPQFFYMPSIVLPLDNSDPTLYDTYTAATQTFTVNLYNRYAAQFGMTATNVAKSASAVNPLPKYNANQLEYFVTYYDANVFTNVSVNDSGILQYSLKPSPLPLSEKTFMNIIFEVKPNS